MVGRGEEGWRPLHGLGSKGGWKWHCIRGNYGSRPCEVTPNGFRYRASPTNPTPLHPERAELGASPPLEGVLSPLDGMNRC